MFSAQNSSGNEKLPDDHARSPERAWQIFMRLLKSKNLRITQARRIVFDEVFSRHDHFSADQLASGLSHGQRHVSRSTVYKTLSLLVEARLVREVCDRFGRVHYEHTFGHPPHEHMICEQCGCFFEFTDDSLSRQIAEDCHKLGFVPRGYRVTVFGTCQEFVEGGPNACPHYRKRRTAAKK